MSVTRDPFNGQLEKIHLPRVKQTMQIPGSLAPDTVPLSRSQDVVRYGQNALPIIPGRSDNLSSMSAPSFIGDDGNPTYFDRSRPSMTSENFNQVGNRRLGPAIADDCQGRNHPQRSLPQHGPDARPLPDILSYDLKKNFRDGSFGAAESTPRNRIGLESNLYDPAPNMTDSAVHHFRGIPNEWRADQRTNKTPKTKRPKNHSSGRQEFDGPVQYLDILSSEERFKREGILPWLPINLETEEQDDIFQKLDSELNKCAFHFVARHKFPIPLVPDKRRVCRPEDREWNEWVDLLKRLATKRMIPKHLVYNEQIKQLITVLESSVNIRHAAKHTSRPGTDDRNVLQLISAGIQVAKILKDASAMKSLDDLYTSTDLAIQTRRNGGSARQPGDEGEKKCLHWPRLALVERGGGTSAI